jgi:hypothetical protein
MPSRFTFPDEVLALFLTNADAAKRLARLLKDYEFPKQQQTEVAVGLLDFYAEYKAPAAAHAFEFVKAEHHDYLRELQQLAPTVHGDYVTNRLAGFLREGKIRRNMTTALDHMQMGEWDDIEKLWMGYSREDRATLFDPGIRLRGEALRSLLAEDPDDFVYLTGIDALDQAHIGPGPKTMFTYVAPPKRGKSWALINQGKTSLRQRLVVAHVSLEMNQRQVAKRYVQSILSLTKRAADEIDTTYFDLDAVGRLQGLQREKVKRPKLDLSVYDRANELLSRMKLYVKEFPTRSITVEDLEVWLDELEETEHVVPDVLLVDYMDLFKMDADRIRVDTGLVGQSLRGIAGKRGCAVVTASQSNRSSANSQWVREDMVAEDWSKIMTSDTVLTYSQTPDERALGLARLFVSNARDEGDKWACVISQSYAIGQFCLDSVRMPDDTYFRIVESALGKIPKGDDDGAD